jgi:hypothetical protein
LKQWFERAACVLCQSFHAGNTGSNPTRSKLLKLLGMTQTNNILIFKGFFPSLGTSGTESIIYGSTFGSKKEKVLIRGIDLLSQEKG